MEIECPRNQPRCLSCCSLYLVRVLIVVIMGRWSDFSACIVCQVVRLYSVVEIFVISGEVVCCSVMCGTLVGVSVFSMMCSELVIMSEISCPLWSSVCEYQCVECAFTSPVSIESGILVTYRMRCLCPGCCNVVMPCLLDESTCLQL